MVHHFPAGQKLNVGIVGATGVVGSTMREILKERNFPIEQLRLFASARSAGKVVDGVTIEDAATADYSGLDIVLFSAGGSTSKALAPKVAAAGAVVMGVEVVGRGDGWQRVRLPIAVLRAVACVLFPIGLAWVLLDRERRSAQDVLLGTRVVYRRV